MLEPHRGVCSIFEITGGEPRLSLAAICSLCLQEDQLAQDVNHTITVLKNEGSLVLASAWRLHVANWRD